MFIKCTKLLFATLLFLCGLEAHASDQASGTKTVRENHMAQPIQESPMPSNNQAKAVITRPNGLQYKILVAGAGKKPGANSTVVVDYEGKLTDGTVFDSSYKRGEPAVFPVNGVIKGWQEALQLMPVGSTWILYIPASLAYGAKGAGAMIGPNEALVFKVHLIAIR